MNPTRARLIAQGIIRPVDPQERPLASPNAIKSRRHESGPVARALRILQSAGRHVARS